MTPQDIENFHKGSGLYLQVFAKNPGGNQPISSPTSQVLIMTIGEGYAGPTVLEFDDKSSVVDEPTAEFLISLSRTDLTDLKEGRTYYYNIWSRLGSADPQLQVKGKLVVNPSLEISP